MATEATPGELGSNDQLGLVPERAAMHPLEVEFVRGTLHLNGKPAQEWIDLADSEGTRAVKYLRRARKAEAALADALFVLGMVDKNNRIDAGEKGKAWSGRFVVDEVRRVLAGKPAPDFTIGGPNSAGLTQCVADNARLAEQVDNLRAALQWYADGLHFDKASPDAWDTVSGEPQNWWCDEAGTATVEDGSIAAMVLRGELTGAQVQAME
jgi:hypothetical protein